MANSLGSPVAFSSNFPCTFVYPRAFIEYYMIPGGLHGSASMSKQSFVSIHTRIFLCIGVQCSNPVTTFHCILIAFFPANVNRLIRTFAVTLDLIGIVVLRTDI